MTVATIEKNRRRRLSHCTTGLRAHAPRALPNVPPTCWPSRACLLHICALRVGASSMLDALSAPHCSSMQSERLMRMHAQFFSLLFTVTILDAFSNYPYNLALFRPPCRELYLEFRTMALILWLWYQLLEIESPKQISRSRDQCFEQLIEKLSKHKKINTA